MRFMTMVKSAENQGPPPAALMEAIAKLGEEAFKSGKLVEMGLLPSVTGARVTLRRGKLSVTDGPFTETKELIGGFAVFELNSREEAIEEARKFMEVHRLHWPEWEGETEVREMFSGGPPQR